MKTMNLSLVALALATGGLVACSPSTKAAAPSAPVAVSQVPAGAGAQVAAAPAGQAGVDPKDAQMPKGLKDYGNQAKEFYGRFLIHPAIDAAHHADQVASDPKLATQGHGIMNALSAWQAKHAAAKAAKAAKNQPTAPAVVLADPAPALDAKAAR